MPTVPQPPWGAQSGRNRRRRPRFGRAADTSAARRRRVRPAAPPAVRPPIPARLDNPYNRCAVTSSAEWLCGSVYRIECACHHKRRDGSPPVTGRHDDMRVPRDAPLPLAGRHTFSSRGRHPPDGPGCLLLGPLVRLVGAACPPSRRRHAGRPTGATSGAPRARRPAASAAVESARALG